MKSRYKVDLPRQLAQCEANYLRLMKLLPSLDTSDEREFALPMAAKGDLRVHIQVEDRAPYTTTVLVSHPKVSQSETLGLSASALSMPDLRVRLYHDATMAEVVSWQRHRDIKPKYDYPNAQMYQQDEKAQLNLFLGEWLSHCLAQGHAVHSPLGLAG
jgi:uncharacterized protein YqiB (DUF1249 family)